MMDFRTTCKPAPDGVEQPRPPPKPPGAPPRPPSHSLGIPETSLRGRSTRTARSVRRSNWEPTVARMLRARRGGGQRGGTPPHHSRHPDPARDPNQPCHRGHQEPRCPSLATRSPWTTAPQPGKCPPSMGCAITATKSHHIPAEPHILHGPPRAPRLHHHSHGEPTCPHHTATSPRPCHHSHQEPPRPSRMATCPRPCRQRGRERWAIFSLSGLNAAALPVLMLEQGPAWGVVAPSQHQPVGSPRTWVMAGGPRHLDAPQGFIAGPTATPPPPPAMLWRVLSCCPSRQQPAGPHSSPSPPFIPIHPHHPYSPRWVPPSSFILVASVTTQLIHRGWGWRGARGEQGGQIGEQGAGGARCRGEQAGSKGGAWCKGCRGRGKRGAGETGCRVGHEGGRQGQGGAGCRSWEGAG